MKEYRWIKFFTEKDYKNLKYKHLEREEYRKFIKAIHERIAKKEVVLNKEGFEMPLNLGKIQVLKKYKPKGVNLMYKKEKEYNTHSFGYVYSVKAYKSKRSVWYTAIYDISNKLKGSFSVSHYFYRFIPHRENIKRAITKVINEQILDYHEA